WRNIGGMTRNSNCDGSTSQNTPVEKSAICAGGAPSRQSQTIVRTEVSGSEAINAPNQGRRRASSDAVATINAEMATLSRNWVTCDIPRQHKLQLCGRATQRFVPGPADDRAAAMCVAEAFLLTGRQQMAVIDRDFGTARQIIRSEDEAEVPQT